jgi:hypothetical protein
MFIFTPKITRKFKYKCTRICFHILSKLSPVPKNYRMPLAKNHFKTRKTMDLSGFGEETKSKKDIIFSSYKSLYEDGKSQSAHGSPTKNDEDSANVQYLSLNTALENNDFKTEHQLTSKIVGSLFLRLSIIKDCNKADDTKTEADDLSF